jgi:7-cyano-7-deazaguanine synthase
MAKERAVVLCSGGLNSAVAAAVAASDHELAMLHARFGHRAAQREEICFKKQVASFDAAHALCIDMPHVEQIGGNARVSRKLPIEDALAIGEGRSTSHIPGLIGSLLGAAFQWASVIGATKIFLGVSEDLGPPGPRTGSIYPDHCREYVELLKYAYRFASDAKPLSLETPVIDLSRTEIIKLGSRLGAPFDLTWSCISSASEPCGGCLGCATRNRGFLDAALPDPILCEPAADPV